MYTAYSVEQFSTAWQTFHFHYGPFDFAVNVRECEHAKIQDKKSCFEKTERKRALHERVVVYPFSYQSVEALYKQAMGKKERELKKSCGKMSDQNGSVFFV